VRDAEVAQAFVHVAAAAAVELGSIDHANVASAIRYGPVLFDLLGQIRTGELASLVLGRGVRSRAARERQTDPQEKGDASDGATGFHIMNLKLSDALMASGAGYFVAEAAKAYHSLYCSKAAGQSTSGPFTRSQGPIGVGDRH
jgi:hypothetical protein